jgi:beta-xylosidase
VATGWQLVLRSKNVYGPYERKVVMDQGTSPVNGPHQGAWVTTPQGEDWFLHFQDQEAYGRVVHLQPMTWVNDWPVIGADKDGDGKGEPVLTYAKPRVKKSYPVQTPPESDEFNGPALGRQWQWPANPKATWAFLNPASGSLRLYSDMLPAGARNLWEVPNVLQQKFPAETFMVTTKMTFKPNSPKLENEKAGLAVLGLSYASLALQSKKDGLYLVQALGKDAGQGKEEKQKVLMKVAAPTVYFRVKVLPGAQCQFSYSFDGQQFTDTGDAFPAEVGRWKGAKVGLFCTRETQTNDSGYVDVDWFRVEPVQ